MDLGRRFKERMEEVGLSQAELSRRVGIKQPSVSYLIANGAQGSKHLIKLARELRTTPEYLMGETDEPEAPGLSEQRIVFSAPPMELGELADPDLVDVAEIDLRYGMGATDLEVPFTTSKRQFSRAWLRQYTSARPEDLVWAQGIGDSMWPTILDSDGLLIDLTEKSIHMSDKIWALAFGHAGMVKRLRPMPDGSVKIISDKDGIPEERAHDDEMHVIGRVVAIVRKM